MADPSPRRFSVCRLIPLGLLVAAGGAFVLGGGHRYLPFASLAEHREFLVALVARGGVFAAIGFVLLYAGLTALSVPGAMLMTLASGFLFGPWLGTLYALIGATLGASAVFLGARAGLAGLAERAGARFRRLEAGFRQDAFSYLLCLRLVPLFPFWLVNLVAGATGIRLGTYVAATFLGMIPGTFVYASIGSGVGALIETGQHPDHNAILRPAILLPLIGLAALALLPVAYKHWKRTPAGGGAMTPLTPDLCVIGGGAGGLAVAAGAAQMGASVVLIERGQMGGDCLNVGCVPSKSLLASARLAHGWRRGADMGVLCTAPRVDVAAVSDSVARVVARLAPNDSVERFEGLGVRILRAEAKFADPRTVRAGDAAISARRFVIATGSAPAVPPIAGLDTVPYFTNETIFANRAALRHLLVIGGGAVGIELAQAHRRLGAEVTVIDMGPLLPRDDPELAALLAERLAAEGIALRPSTAIAAVEPDASGVAIVMASGERIAGSHLLAAAGRQPNIAALDLAAGGIAATRHGVTVDARLRTSNRAVYAIGDVAGGPQFTHVALYHAGIVIRNALFRLPARVDYRALPWVTYTDPELAQAGMSEATARDAHGDKIRVLRWSFAENDRAQTERDTAGMVKVVAAANGRILGAAILGAGAGDQIAAWALAISQRLKIGAVANLIMPYPTRGEAGKRAAGSFYTPTLFSPRTRRLVRLLARFG